MKLRNQKTEICLFSNNQRKMHGLPLHRKSNKKKRFYKKILDAIRESFKETTCFQMPEDSEVEA